MLCIKLTRYTVTLVHYNAMLCLEFLSIRELKWKQNPEMNLRLPFILFQERRHGTTMMVDELRQGMSYMTKILHYISGQSARQSLNILCNIPHNKVSNILPILCNSKNYQFQYFCLFAFLYYTNFLMYYHRKIFYVYNCRIQYNIIFPFKLFSSMISRAREYNIHQNREKKNTLLTLEHLAKTYLFESLIFSIVTSFHYSFPIREEEKNTSFTLKYFDNLFSLSLVESIISTL